jgi:hypothetical protein
VSEGLGDDSRAGAGERGRELAALVRTDRDSAKRLLAALPLEEQVKVVSQLPAERRADALALAPDPGAVVRRMPELDLCAATVAAGPERSGWLLEHATDAQIVACVDLDSWRGSAVDTQRLDVWLTGLADAGDRTLLRAPRALDPELLALWARRDVEFFVRAGEDEDWEPPDDTRTIDGEHHFRARRPDADLELFLRVLYVLFENDQPLYMALVHDVAASGSAVDEEQALHWRGGRLIDLGFPNREEALAAYAWLDPDTSLELPAADRREEAPTTLPAPPARPLLPYPMFEAIAALSPEERERALIDFMQLSNKVLVAEGLSLGDADTVRQAMGRAADLASRGLEALLERNDVDDVEVLRRASVEHLFRIGANLTGAAAALLKAAADAEEGPE